MRKVILFIAMSLDGYIADQDGSVHWLTGQDPNADSDDSYATFEKTIDTVIMGWKTYHQITTELSPEQWVYDRLKSYVITHRECPPFANITFLSTDPCTLVDELKQKEGKDIWICGGADLVRQLIEKDKIDRYHISVIPTLLGDGIPLFSSQNHQIRLRLLKAQSVNGIMEMVYEKLV